VGQQRLPVFAAGVADSAPLGDGIDMTAVADAMVAEKNLFAKIAGLRAQLPFVDAVFGAEGEAAGRDFERAPAAEAASVGTARNVLAVYPAAGHSALLAHDFFVVDGRMD